jgi:diguanylate cyclase (GGDEF)-like protein/PAS domain S-box-containing protein
MLYPSALEVNAFDSGSNVPVRPGFDLGDAAPDFFKGLLDQMADGVYFVDKHRRILYWNEGAHRLTGYKAEEMIGRFCQDDTLCHVDSEGIRLCKSECPLTACVNDGEAHEAVVFLRHKQGRRVPVSVRVQPIRAANGSILGAVEIFSDVTAQYAAHRRTEDLERLAFLDQLTQLPNRRYLEKSVQSALDGLAMDKDSCGLLWIDVDHFKSINDRFGHPTGDRALQEVARTLAAVMRVTDLLGRWGGDEFVAIIRNVGRDGLQILADRCCLLVAQSSIDLPDGGRISMSVSIGGSLAGPDDTVESLVERADGLMYQSKSSGRGRALVE